jgi:hypothetical protein
MLRRVSYSPVWPPVIMATFPARAGMKPCGSLIITRNLRNDTGERAAMLQG